VLAGAGVAAGYALRGEDEAVPQVTTATVTETVTVPASSGLPEAVERKRQEVLAAAESGDHDAVAALADPDGFEYTFGGPVEGGPAEYWRQLEEETDERPLEALAAVLKLPYTLSRGIYYWPFAFDKQADEITDYERELLQTIPGGSEVGESGYLGWRAGITPGGDWIFFVAGD
jgi:hypothetical protein